MAKPNSKSKQKAGAKKKPVAKSSPKKAAVKAKPVKKIVKAPIKKAAKPTKTKVKVKVKAAVKKKPVKKIVTLSKTTPKKNSKQPKKVPVKANPKKKTAIKTKAPVKKGKATKKPIARVASKKLPKTAPKKAAKKIIPKKTVAKKPVKKAVIKKPVKKPTPPKKVAPPAKKKVVAAAIPAKKSIQKPSTVAKSFKKEVAVAKPVKAPKVKPEKGKKGKGKKEEEEEGFEIDESIELEIEQLKAKKKKAPAGPKIIKTPPVMHLGLDDKEIEYSKLVKSTVIPKNSKYKKFELEFTINASNTFLFPFFLTPSELAEWFADDVNIKGDMYTFFWDGSTQVAKMVAKKEGHYVRFKWVDEPDPTYFEFRLEVDDITQDVALIITDFAEDDESREASTLLWNSQVDALMHVIGA
jgi:hypothetical protein